VLLRLLLCCCLLLLLRMLRMLRMLRLRLRLLLRACGSATDYVTPR
jgi:hypothetical protein